jgi:DNA-binding TFAR19-related protein (PDSD5 family)
MNEDTLRMQRTREIESSATNEAKQAEENRAAAEWQLDALLTKVLSTEAKTRMTNVRMVNPEKYLQAAQLVLQLAKRNGLSRKLSEEEVKNILQHLTPTKKEFTITRK